ncbi:MAG: hypothetical protein K1W22_15705 [Lachnospiraceae bacterium]
MDQKEIMEQINKLTIDNPAKFIKIRDAFDDMFDGRNINSVQAISDREYERLRGRFRDDDIPLSLCTSKETIYQLYKAVNQRRTRDRHDGYQTTRKSAKSKKKGFFGGLFS